MRFENLPENLRKNSKGEKLTLSEHARKSLEGDYINELYHVEAVLFFGSKGEGMRVENIFERYGLKEEDIEDKELGERIFQVNKLVKELNRILDFFDNFDKGNKIEYKKELAKKEPKIFDLLEKIMDLIYQPMSKRDRSVNLEIFLDGYQDSKNRYFGFKK